MERTLADLAVVTKTDVKSIVENLLVKRIGTLQSQIVKAVESTIWDTLQAGYLNSNNGLNICYARRRWTSTSKVTPSDRAPIVSKAEMCSLVQTKKVVEKIV